MSEDPKQNPRKKYVYVKDSDGVEYVCRIEDLKKVDELTDEEKDKCMAPPGDA